MARSSASGRVFWLAAPLLLLTASIARPASRPNVILIVGDDQAYSDFGFMGHDTIRTPHIDELARDSCRFINGYVPTSLCRPSLATLLTGLYPHQHLVHFNDPPNKANRQEAERYIVEAATLPRLLAQAGYKCLQTGKFWEGRYSNAGFTAGMTHGDPNRERRHTTLGVLRGRHGDEGLAIGRDGLAPIYQFLATRGDAPFFIWYAPMMPHEPHTPPAKFRQLYDVLGLHPRVAAYYAMCSWFDQTIGDLRAHLAEQGLAENTLLVFAVDNGWIQNTAAGGPAFAQRSKRSPYEKGVRTPILLHWPGQIKAQSVADLASTVDVAPTVLAACGVRYGRESFAGINLLPRAMGAPASTSGRAVFGEIYEHDASVLGEPANDLVFRWIRFGRWKLIVSHRDAEDVQLFDVEADPDERSDLSKKAEAVDEQAELRRRLDEWWRPGTRGK